MTFVLLSSDALASHLGSHYGVAPFTSGEALAEVARCELFALGHTLRWVLARRVTRLVGALGATTESAEEALLTLELAGDLLAGPGGEVAKAPLRAVSVRPGRWLFAGSVPTAELQHRMKGAWAGTPRRLTTLDDARVTAAVAELCGRVLTLDAWAGLSKVPPVRQWEAELEARLSAASRFADRANSLRWEGEEVFIAGRGWQAGTPGDWAVLVRARQSGGWWAYAWSLRGDGSVARVPLTLDDSRRTMLAVAAAAGSVPAFEVTGAGGRARISLPAMVPAAELRWLSAMGEVNWKAREVEVAEGDVAAVREMLGERLGGMVVEGTT